MIKYLCVKEFFLHPNTETPYINKGDVLEQKPDSRMFMVIGKPDISIGEHIIWENKKHFEII